MTCARVARVKPAYEKTLLIAESSADNLKGLKSTVAFNRSKKKSILTRPVFDIRQAIVPDEGVGIRQALRMQHYADPCRVHLLVAAHSSVG